MPRIRTLKPEIIEDEKVGALDDTAFRLFTSMIVLADDHGNVRADVRWLQAQIWWGHANPPNVLLALIALERAQLVEVYAVRGGTYAHLRGWAKHQRIDNAGKGRVPSRSEADLDSDLGDRTTVPIRQVGRAESDSDQSEFSGTEFALGTQPEGATVPVRQAGRAERPPDIVRGESPRTSASLRDSRLDPDQDQDKDLEGEQDGECARARAIPPRRTTVPGSPSEWVPGRAECDLAVKFSLDADDEAAGFRDWHVSHGSWRKLDDVDAAFRTWLRRARRFATENGKRKKSTAGGEALERVLEIADEKADAR